MQSESEQQQRQKIYLFWTVYVLDASFSTRLGRLPVVREHDISVPMISSVGAVPESFVKVLRYWIELCRRALVFASIHTPISRPTVYAC
jgi:hypothetical protein